jgi:hypothetical protein
MTEQRKWPDNWEWVDKEERTPATEAEAAAMVAKIEDRLRKIEAAAKADPRDLIERVAREIVAKHYPEHAAEIMSGKYKGRRMAIVLDALARAKPEVDEATLVTRKMFARMEEVKGYTARSSDYHFGHADKENHFQTARAVIAEALAVPDDVEKAARWIFDNSDSWTDLAKASAQKLAEYALRGKQ